MYGVVIGAVMVMMMVVVVVAEAVLFEALATAQEAPVFEHVPAGGVEGPVAALARAVWAAGQFDEAVVEGEVVAEGILPALRVLAVVGEAVHDELVNLAQRHHLSEIVAIIY